MLTWEDTEVLSYEPLGHYQIIRRNGAVVPFEPSKIAIAMMNSFRALHAGQGGSAMVGEPWLHLVPNAAWLLSDLCKDWARHLSSLNRLSQWALIKLLGKFFKTAPVKVSGFFSSSKANLHNAP